MPFQCSLGDERSMQTAHARGGNPKLARVIGGALSVVLTLLLAAVPSPSAQAQTPSETPELDEGLDDLFGDDEDDGDLFGDGDLIGDEGTEEDEAVAEADDPALEAQQDPDRGTSVDPVQPEFEELGGALGSEPTAGMEEILVQGQASAAVDVDATSQVSFDATDLEAQGIEDVSDLGQFTPNLQITQGGSTTATFFIRGVGLSDFSANAAGAVAIYHDGVPLSTPALQLTPLFDVLTVDVLRGPQGAGNFRNASAGVINVVAKTPDGTFDATGKVSLGQVVSPVAIDGPQRVYDAAVSFPILGDVLASRVAFRYLEDEPFFTNGCGGAPVIRRRGQSLCGERVGRQQTSRVPAGLPKEIGESDQWGARAMFRLLPPDVDIDYTLNVHGSRLREDQTTGQAIGTGTGGQDFGAQSVAGYQDPDVTREFRKIEDRFLAQGLSRIAASDAAFARLESNLAETRPLDKGPYRGDVNLVGRTTRDTIGGSVSGTSVFDAFELKTLSAFDWYQRSRHSDTDFTPDRLFHLTQDDTGWQLVQELDLIGELDRYAVTWALGGGYRMDSLESQTLLEPAERPFVTNRDYEQKAYNFAIYGSLDWEFLDSFQLQMGLRYNWERKDFFITQLQTADFGIPNVENGDVTWTAPTGMIQLTYRFSDEASSYWKYTRGFKAGHFNSNGVRDADDPNITRPVAATPAKPEYIDSFEWGFDLGFFDGALAGNGAVFFYQYKDYQVFRFEDNPGSFPVLEVINANDAQVLGAEIDTLLLPFELEAFEGVPDVIRGLEFVVRGSWLESQFLDFTTEEIRASPTGRQLPVTIDFSGNQLIGSPRWQASGSVSWAFDLGRFGHITPRWDWTWTDDVFFDASGGRGSLRFDGTFNKPEFATGQPAYWLHNVRLTYSNPENTLQVGGWCRNIADERYKTFAFDASGFSKVVLNFVGDPRTCGVDLTFNF